MKKQIIALLSGILALARTPKDEDQSEESIKAQKKQIELIRDEIDTLHGDEDFNADEVKELINDLIEVSETSEPGEGYGEFPELPEDVVEGEKKVQKKKKVAAAAEEEPAEEPAEEATEPPAEEEAEEEDEEPAETPKERKRRLAAEAEAATRKSNLKKRRH